MNFVFHSAYRTLNAIRHALFRPVANRSKYEHSARPPNSTPSSRRRKIDWSIGTGYKIIHRSTARPRAKHWLADFGKRASMRGISFGRELSMLFIWNVFSKINSTRLDFVCLQDANAHLRDSLATRSAQNYSKPLIRRTQKKFMTVGD